MSPRTAHRSLFLALLLMAPLPMLGFDAFVPVARHLLLAGVCIGMRLVEGPGGVVWQLTALFLGHALVYAIALWLASWLVALLLRAFSDRLRGACVAALVVGALLWASFSEPYVTPFGRAARANLVEVLR